MLRQLLFHPSATIARELEREDRSVFVPFFGYALLSFSEASDRVVDIGPEVPRMPLLVLNAFLALILGSFLWAFLFGGALHASALLWGGRRGFRESIEAVGYGFFWPGILAAIGTTAAYAGVLDGEDLSALGCAALLVVVSAGVWGIYLAIAAIRVRHGLGWLRAIATYLSSVAVLVVVGVVVFLVLPSLAAS